MDGTVTKL